MVFPLTARQFSATFLDFQRNSRGYSDKVESADQDVAKRLLNPLFTDFEVFPIPQCHRFGKAMWAFAKECTAAVQHQSTNHNTDMTLPPFRFDSEGDLQVSPSRVDELPRSSEASKNQPTSTSCPELNEQPNVEELSAGPLKSDFVNRSSSHFENYVELDNLEPRITLNTDCHPQNGYGKRVDIHGGSESKHGNLLSDDGKCIKNKKNVKTEECVVSMLEDKDGTKDQDLCDATISEKQNTVMLNESLHKESHIMSLSLYKKGNHSTIPISRSLTVNLHLDALLSVLQSEKKTVKYAEHDSSIYGKVAVLYGFQQNSTVSVLQAEMVGWYDYISGTVNGLQQGLCHDDSESQVENNTLQLK